jgi:hypothetical protein
MYIHVAYHVQGLITKMLVAKRGNFKKEKKNKNKAAKWKKVLTTYFVLYI